MQYLNYACKRCVHICFIPYTEIIVGNSNPKPVTLLAQLANMPSMSPLISSPVPLVGSVVPNITESHLSTQPEVNILYAVPTVVSHDCHMQVGTNIELSADGDSDDQDASHDF